MRQSLESVQVETRSNQPRVVRIRSASVCGHRARLLAWFGPDLVTILGRILNNPLGPLSSAELSIFGVGEELTQKLSGPLADEHGNVPIGKDSGIAS